MTNLGTGGRGVRERLERPPGLRNRERRESEATDALAHGQDAREAGRRDAFGGPAQALNAIVLR